MKYKNKIIFLIIIIGIFISLLYINSYLAAKDDHKTLLLFVDRTLQLPIEELIELFREEYGYSTMQITTIYGSSGHVLSQLELYGRGDLYVSDGGHFLEEGVRRGLINRSSIKAIGYLKVSLLVGEGNPKNIKNVYDALIRDDIKLAIGNPEHVIAGIIAKDILLRNGLWSLVEDGISGGRVVFAKSAYIAASYVKLGVVDCAITFKVFEYFDEKELDEVYDPILEEEYGEVVIALPINASKIGRQLYHFIIKNLDVFYKYGIMPLMDGAYE